MEIGLERAFAIIGFIATISLVLIVIFNIVCFIGVLIKRSYKKHKINRRNNRDLGILPTAKCFCCVCRHAKWYGGNGYGSCELWGDDIKINEHSFCYCADPKIIERNK